MRLAVEVVGAGPLELELERLPARGERAIEEVARLRRSGEAVDVTVWKTPSAFVQRTVEPAATRTSAGWKANGRCASGPAAVRTSAATAW